MVVFLVQLTERNKAKIEMMLRRERCGAGKGGGGSNELIYNNSIYIYIYIIAFYCKKEIVIHNNLLLFMFPKIHRNMKSKEINHQYYKHGII